MLDILSLAVIPVGDQDGVSSGWKDKAWLTNGQVIEALSHVATRNSQALHAWEPSSFVEEGVDESVILLAALVESWVHAFQSKVDFLSRWDVDSNLQLLDCLCYFEVLNLSPFVGDGSYGRSEVWWSEELSKRHEENAVISQLVVSRLQICCCPSLGILVRPCSFVSFRRPWISDLDQLGSLDSDHIKQRVCMSVLESVGCTCVFS